MGAHLPAVWHIDDNPGDLELVEIALVGERLRLRSFSDQAVALGVLMGASSDELPDLLLLDIHMPAIDGREFLRLVRSEPRFDRLRIGILTGVGLPPGHELLRCPGAQGVLRKPVTVAELPALRDAVAAILGATVQPAALVLRRSG